MIDDVRCKVGKCDKLDEFVRNPGAAPHDVPWMQSERKGYGVTPLAKKAARVAPLGRVVQARGCAPGVAFGSTTKRIKAFDI
jgi:hypothetical protein